MNKDRKREQERESVKTGTFQRGVDLSTVSQILLCFIWRDLGDVSGVAQRQPRSDFGLLSVGNMHLTLAARQSVSTTRQFNCVMKEFQVQRKQESPLGPYPVWYLLRHTQQPPHGLVPKIVISYQECVMVLESFGFCKDLVMLSLRSIFLVI